LMDCIDEARLDEQIQRLDTKLGKMGRVVGRCLREDRRLRYDNGHELLLDLRRYLFKEHGAYLREFCDYYFTALQPLEPLEPLDARARPDKPRRVDPMSNDKKPPRPGAPPRPSRGGPPRPGGARPGGPPGPRSSSGRPPSGARPPASGRPPSAAPPSRPSGYRPPGTPEASPAPSSGRFKSGSVKTPDATGMLPMVPLGSDKGNEPTNKSATQFFAIPGAQKAVSPPPGVGGAVGGRSLPQAPSASIAPISGPGALPPGQSSGGFASGPVAAPMAMQGGISGPVASGPKPGAQSMSPFQVGNGGSPPPGDSENRSRSMRIYLILFVLFGMVCSVAVIVVLAVVLGLNAKNNDDGSSAETPVTTEPSPRPAGGGDTATPPPPMPSQPYVAPARPRPQPGTGPASAPSPRPARASSTGTVTIMVPEGQRFTGVEIKCDGSGFRNRGAFSGQSARVQDVPNESCTLYFKGGAPAQFRPVSGGRSYSCEFPAPGTATCR
jgi:hypothetical protein